jgi:hypothetical protein
MKEPTLYLDFEEDDMNEGMDALSFVDRPATEIKWELFQLQDELKKLPYSKHVFRDFNEEKRLVTAPVMVAETKIPRFNPEIGKYNVMFSKDTIEKMMKKYFKENKIHKVNTNHDPTQKKEGVYMVESFIVGDRTTSNVFPNLPDGSWVASYYVQNDEVWDKIKEGEYNGFSLEGYFIEKYEDSLIEKVEEQLQEIAYSNDSDEIKKEKIKDLLGIK